MQMFIPVDQTNVLEEQPVSFFRVVFYPHNGDLMGGYHCTAYHEGGGIVFVPNFSANIPDYAVP
jgi:hypothetical protein